MDTNIEIKSNDPLNDDGAFQNGRKIVTKDPTIMTNSDAVLLGDYCDVTMKTVVKLEDPFPDVCLKQINSEIVASSNSCEIDVETEIEQQTLVSDFASQNKREFLPDDPLMKANKCNSDHDGDNKMEIKVEPWWLETENSSVCDDIKDGDFHSVKLSRMCLETVSGDTHINLPLPSTEVSGRDAVFCNTENHPKCQTQKNVTEIPNVEKHVLSKQFGKCNDEDIYSRTPYSKDNKGKRLHQCTICGKRFKNKSDFKRHELIHSGERPYICKVCEKSFIRLGHLKRHTLIHEGKKPYHCKVCDKNFTDLSNLKRHNLFHEGNKSQQCKICGKSFSRLSHLREHTLIHEGKKPHQCITCDKSFTRLSDFKTHNLIHEGQKPHQCKTCNKNFTRLSHLKTHNLIHEGKKTHQCETCGKSFTQLPHLKRHHLIHESNKVIYV